MPANEDIRNAAKLAKVPLWKIGEAFGVKDDRFSEMLRYEFSDDMKAKTLKIIDCIATGASIPRELCSRPDSRAATIAAAKIKRANNYVRRTIYEASRYGIVNSDNLYQEFDTRAILAPYGTLDKRNY